METNHEIKGIPLCKERSCNIKRVKTNKQKVFLVIIMCVSSLVFAQEKKSGIKKSVTHHLIDIQSVNPNIRIDIRYATENNFMKKKVYESAMCLLREEVAERLSHVQKKLESEGLGLKIYDAYRPLSAQWELWKIVPNPIYVADPRKGSKHNRGAAIDLTLVDSSGKELEMPTGYDEFVRAARSNYPKLSQAVLKNRKRLQDAMTAEGFIINPSEWWHFDDCDWKQFPILDVSFSEVQKK